MDIEDIRRARLADWFKDRSIPPKEKSYISQLVNKKSPFGEKAARRLEDQYGMGERYLDKTSEEERGELDRFLRGVGIGYVKAEVISELILLFSQSSPTGQKAILNLARSAAEESLRNSGGGLATNNKL